MFDKLYTVVDGNCIYQGPVRELIPFLEGQDLVCPSYHNPADFCKSLTKSKLWNNEACSKIASNLKRFPAAISKLTASTMLSPPRTTCL
ncbi:unnamed protein product [Ceratitis capitata]|uniref:(Mediterranean fruit fly) hypothetical protein n=1 Tax=Ceratitis capitata TaxID=7213 RepID=A0A811UL24_CERCA|nr:unnamed protein product [Ceratitis capitata]